MKTAFVSEDGLFFLNEEECLKYEEELNLPMKIYLVTGDVTGYDTYDSVVVSARGVDQAKNLCLCEYGRDFASGLGQITVEEIGVSNIKESNIILASFNAG